MDHVTSTTVLFFLYIFCTNHEILGIEVDGQISTNIEKKNEIYDCVDFYKQPAFNHPLLANHTFHHEMRPSFMPLMTRSKAEGKQQEIEVRFKSIGCQVGTVPIRRKTEEDHFRERLQFEKYGLNYDLLSQENPSTHYGLVRTKWDPKKKYNGGSTGISIWNPSVQSSQYSSGQLVIRNGNDNIQVGWTVNPTLYGDNRTRLFIYTGAGSTQCYNTYCPGFIVVNKDIPLDDLATVSKRGGPIYFVQLMIYKEGDDGDWWLRIGPKFAPIGFWPKKIFTTLADGATSVEWGGQVYSPPGVPSPPMGSGEYLRWDTRYDAYCKFVRVINEDHEVVDAVNIETYADSPSYQVKAVGIRGEHYGNLVVFGGPGGVTGT